MCTFESFGVKRMTKEEFKDNFFLPYFDFYKKYIQNATKEKIDSLYKESLEIVPNPSIYPKVKNILEDLYNKNVKMVVLSSHPQKELTKEAKIYGVDKLFISINGSIHDKREKIKDIILQNNFSLENTIYVGDMIHDIEAAKTVGIRIIAVTYGYDSEDKIKKAKPDFVIDKPEEIMEIIK